MPPAKSAARTWIALIRGINVGKAKRVAMADLRELVEGLGYRDAKTLLNSGNVVFTSSGAAQGDPGPKIEGAMTKRLGVSARVMVIGADELAEAVRANPLAKVAKDPARMLVAVIGNPADRKLLAPLAKQDWSPEALAIGTRVAYLWCADGILDSPLLKAASKALGNAITSRNWTTMTKLHALAESRG